MKKIKISIILAGILICFSFFCLESKNSRAAVNADGSVPVNEENFPDERFRCLAARYDTDKNNILSLKERSVLKHLYIEYIDPFYYQDTTIMIWLTPFSLMFGQRQRRCPGGRGKKASRRCR